MKVLIFAVVIIASLVQIQADISTIVKGISELGRMFIYGLECQRDLGLLDKPTSQFSSADFACFNVCVHQYLGLLVNGKYQVDKTVEDYIKHARKPSEAGSLALIECIEKANKEDSDNICDVARVFIDCRKEKLRILNLPAYEV